MTGFQPFAPWVSAEAAALAAHEAELTAAATLPTDIAGLRASG